MRVPLLLDLFWFVLALPVLLPWALVSHGLHQRRLRATAEADPCPACGGPLGVAALWASDERWQAHIAELLRTRPGIRFRLVRQVHAICVCCGARLHFDKATGAFARSESAF